MEANHEEEGRRQEEVLTMPSVERRTFADMLDALYANRHTGPVTIHFAQGHPQTVEFPAPPTRIPLDRGERSRHS